MPGRKGNGKEEHKQATREASTQTDSVGACLQLGRRMKSNSLLLIGDRRTERTQTFLPAVMFFSPHQIYCLLGAFSTPTITWWKNADCVWVTWPGQSVNSSFSTTQLGESAVKRPLKCLEGHELSPEKALIHIVGNGICDGGLKKYMPHAGVADLFLDWEELPNVLISLIGTI